MGAGFDTQTPTRSPLRLQIPRNSRSQLYQSDRTLKYVVLRYRRSLG